MSVNSTSTKSSEIRLLRRYQRSLMLGGGILLSTMLLCGAALAVWADIQSYIAEARAVYVANKALITQEIEKKQAAMQRGVIYSELVWRTVDSRRHVDDFRQGRLLMQASPDIVSQLLLAAVTPQQPPQDFARFLEFSTLQAYAVTASASERGTSFAGYFFDPSHSFVSIAAPAMTQALLDNITAADVRSLIDRLAPDIGDLHDPAYLATLRASRRVFWQPPLADPLTGETVLQVAVPAFDDSTRPFAIFVSSIAFDALYKWLRKSSYGGNFMIIDQFGDLILSSWDREAIDPQLTVKVLDSGIWQERLDSSDYIYHDGMFTFSEALGDTGWVFAYAHSWRTILAARGAFVMAYAAGTLLLLSLLWTLIYFYFKKVLSPLLWRSQRVFDSEKLNRTIIATAPNGLCLISERSGKVLLQNQAMKLFDSADDLLLQRLLQLGLRQEGRAIGKNADPVEMHELTITTADNEKRDLLVNFVRTCYLEEDFLLCSFADITERKQLERSLREARAAAEAANHAKSVFLATMSHEIRTPLNGILGNLELLTYTSLTQLQQDRLQTVTHSSRTLLEMINDVLDFSKIESGQMQLESIPFDMIDLVEQAISVFFPMADDKGLDLYYCVTPQFPRSHIGDPTRLRQIVVNLLSNAIKFTMRGKITITLDNAPMRGDNKAAMVLRVADTGVGIPVARRQELFLPFEQGDVSVARQYGGTGLGLSLCQRLTQLMDGRIDIASEPGQGTEFTVSLPLCVAEGEAFAQIESPGGAIAVLCMSLEWSVHLLAQLQTWGLRVRSLTRPEEWRQGDGPLLLFGSPRPWDVASEELLMAQQIRLIDARESGPRLPLIQGCRILVSCYSLEGLQSALRLACNADLPVQSGLASDQKIPCSSIASVQSETVRILVVEDHPVSRALIGEQLRLFGYMVSLADSVSAALQLYNQEKYDIVLTDLSMPEMDGYLLARMLRAQDARLPIVAITANASQEDRQRCYDAGIDDVLLKPMSLREIDRIVRRHLAASRLLSIGPFPPSKKRVLSQKLLHEMYESSEAALEHIRTAYTGGRRDIVLEHLHAIKGAFAMQQQLQVVNACCELECACQSEMPANFLPRLEILASLIRQILKRIS